MGPLVNRPAFPTRDMWVQGEIDGPKRSEPSSGMPIPAYTKSPVIQMGLGARCFSREHPHQRIRELERRK